MDLLANGLLLAATMAAAFYCYILANRVKRLANLDSGLGGAITALSKQVEEMKTSVDAAKKVSGASAKELVAMTARAEIAAGRLELLLATLHENSKKDDGKVSQPKKSAGRL